MALLELGLSRCLSLPGGLFGPISGCRKLQQIILRVIVPHRRGVLVSTPRNAIEAGHGLLNQQLTRCWKAAVPGRYTTGTTTAIIAVQPHHAAPSCPKVSLVISEGIGAVSAEVCTMCLVVSTRENSNTGIFAVALTCAFNEACASSYRQPRPANTFSSIPGTP